jgi:hypothetical protein
LDLSSSVELILKTDYLPLDRMAGKGQVGRIKVNHGIAAYEARFKEQQVKWLTQQAAELQFRLTPDASLDCLKFLESRGQR